jgi:hypothetical protein
MPDPNRFADHTMRDLIIGEARRDVGEMTPALYHTMPLPLAVPPVEGLETPSPLVSEQEAPPEYMRTVKHLGRVYMAVFNDSTYMAIREIWERRAGKWTCIHYYKSGKTSLTQHLKNIAAKAMVTWPNKK